MAELLSIVLPSFNEEGNIAALTEELVKLLPALAAWRVECVFVDDGSTDGTRREMLESRRRHPELGIRVIALERNCGLTGAMNAGFKASRGSVVATMDTDLQNNPLDLPLLLDRLGEADVCIGVRTKRLDPFVKRISSRIANAVRNRLTREKIIDTGCSLKVYRREYLERIKLFTGLHRFLPTLLKMEGARVVQVPVGHRPRVSGLSKYGLGNRLVGPLMDLLAVRWMLKRNLNCRWEEIP